jgi:AcrR family transcriptional regulator
MARRKDHNREELNKMVLDAAWDIIAADGSKALSARSIAQKIGYAPGTIYNLFSSMDELTLHINARTLEMLKAELAKDMPKDLEKSQFVPVAVMKKLAARYMKFARAYKPYWLMLFEFSKPQSEGEAPWYAEKINELFAPLEALLIPYYKEETECKKSARVLWGSVHGLCFLQETGKIENAARNGLTHAKDPALELANMLIENYMAGINVKN